MSLDEKKDTLCVALMAVWPVLRGALPALSAHCVENRRIAFRAFVDAADAYERAAAQEQEKVPDAV